MSQATIDRLVEHINKGGKLIIGTFRPVKIGTRFAKFLGLDDELNDYPVTVIREASYEEWLKEFPGDAPRWTRSDSNGIHFYEVITD